MLVRRILSSVALGALAALPALLTGCPGGGDPPATQASLVVGVQAEDFGGLVEAVHIVATVDGKVADDEMIAIGTSPGAGAPRAGCRRRSCCRARLVHEPRSSWRRSPPSPPRAAPAR